MPEISRQNNKAIVFLHHPLVAKRFIVLVPGCGEKEKFKNREIETESYDAEARQDGGDLSEDNGLVIGADHYVGHHESAYRSQNYSILCQITSTAFAPTTTTTAATTTNQAELCRSKSQLTTVIDDHISSWRSAKNSQSRVGLVPDQQHQQRQQ